MRREEVVHKNKKKGRSLKNTLVLLLLLFYCAMNEKGRGCSSFSKLRFEFRNCDIVVAIVVAVVVLLLFLLQVFRISGVKESKV